MTDTLTRPDARDAMPLSGPRLPQSAPWIVAAVAVVVGVGLGLLLGRGVRRDGDPRGRHLRRRHHRVGREPRGSARRGRPARHLAGVDGLRDRARPLLSLVWTVVSRGFPALSVEFFTFSMRGVIGDAQGGIYHALIGTLLVTLGAAVISIPIGVMTAIYLVEYGVKSRLAGRSPSWSTS